MSKREMEPGPQGGSFSANEWVKASWADMQRRWSGNQEAFVEDYLPDDPGQEIGPDALDFLAARGDQTVTASRIN